MLLSSLIGVVDEYCFHDSVLYALHIIVQLLINSSTQQIIEKITLFTHLLITNINVMHKNANIEPDLFICVSNVDCDIGRICH